MRVTQMNLKQQWYNEIAQGRKRVEFRDFKNQYYLDKICDLSKYPVGMTQDEILQGIKDDKLPIHYDITHIRFVCNGMSMLVEVTGVKVTDDNRFWAISLGKIIQGAKKKDLLNTTVLN